jgi:dTDP-4-dehydrorhamnose 3,5-epimerase
VKVIETALEGVFILELFHAQDNRGSFTKTFHAGDFQSHGLNTQWRESYFSTNHRGVVRGMHFQTPPQDHEKLVFCTRGKLMDVILDLRTASPTYGQHICIELSEETATAVYIPKGMAHGFESLVDETTMVYNVATVYHPENDQGVLYNIFGCAWKTKNPIVSQRDLAFGTFNDYASPF